VKNLDRSKLSVGARWRSLKEIVTAVWRHPANRSRRTQTLWRILGFHFVDRMRAPLGDHSEIWVDRRFSASLKVLIGNPPDWAEMQVWKKRLGPGDLFVDVGTNVGIYSIWAADLGATVIAVEPVEEIRKALEENARLNGYTFEIVPAALSKEAGTMRFTQDWLGTMNHLVPDDQVGGLDVDVRTLDDILDGRSAHGAKIDVEGAERLVLEGGRQTLASGRLPIIQLEWNDMSERIFGESRQVLADMLRRYGYRLYRATDEGDLTPAGADSAPGEIFAVLQRE
jgi:FkbM family methyltransferase